MPNCPPIRRTNCLFCFYLFRSIPLFLSLSAIVGRKIMIAIESENVVENTQQQQKVKQVSLYTKNNTMCISDKTRHCILYLSSTPSIPSDVSSQTSRPQRTNHVCQQRIAGKYLAWTNWAFYDETHHLTLSTSKHIPPHCPSLGPGSWIADDEMRVHACETMLSCQHTNPHTRVCVHLIRPSVRPFRPVCRPKCERWTHASTATTTYSRMWAHKCSLAKTKRQHTSIIQQQQLLRCLLLFLLRSWVLKCVSQWWRWWSLRSLSLCCLSLRSSSWFNNTHTLNARESQLDQNATIVAEFCVIALHTYTYLYM